MTMLFRDNTKWYNTWLLPHSFFFFFWGLLISQIFYILCTNHHWINEFYITTYTPTYNKGNILLCFWPTHAVVWKIFFWNIQVNLVGSWLNSPISRDLKKIFLYIFRSTSEQYNRPLQITHPCLMLYGCKYRNRII